MDIRITDGVMALRTLAQWRLVAWVGVGILSVKIGFQAGYRSATEFCRLQIWHKKNSLLKFITHLKFTFSQVVVKSVLAV